jgi:hypothetical protein
MTDKETKPVLLLAAWFCLALAGGVGRWFHDFSAAGIAIMVWTLTGLALLACWKISEVRAWAQMVDLKWLIALHLTRFVGFYFLVLAGRGELPSGFARPAAVGDIAVALLALVLVAIPLLREMRAVVLTWDLFGLLDILFVVFNALRFGRRDLESMLPLRVLPLSLLPTFLVPLIIVSHVLIFLRMRKR